MLPRMDPKRPPLSQQLRDAIRASGMSQKDICRRLGLHEAQMSRFMAGNEGFGMEALDRLAGLLLDVSPRQSSAHLPRKRPFSGDVCTERIGRNPKNTRKTRSSVTGAPGRVGSHP
jgi:transcriptional regulator with XRE-family HTH domain